MSIINDALRKVQSQLDRKRKLILLPEKTEKNKWFWIAITAIFIGFLGTGTLFLFLITKPQFQINPSLLAQKPQDPSAIRERTKRISSARSSRISRISSRRTGGLVLNGIITMDNTHLALINNEILKEGDYIEGKRIVKIFLDKVEILDNGEIIVLETKN